MKTNNAEKDNKRKTKRRAIPVGDSDFFFVPRSRHAEYSIFSYFFSELKIHHLSLFITYRALRHC